MAGWSAGVRGCSVWIKLPWFDSHTEMLEVVSQQHVCADITTGSALCVQCFLCANVNVLSWVHHHAQVGSGIPPALAAARRLVRSELQAPLELVQVRHSVLTGRRLLMLVATWYACSSDPAMSPPDTSLTLLVMRTILLAACRS